MEANEIHELHEQHEHAAGNPSMRPVSFSMSVLAVLVAIITVLGHRTHTESILFQAKASDQWNFYQAKKIRQNGTQLTMDLFSAVQLRDPAAAAKLLDGYKAHQAKWDEDLNEEQKKAEEFEAEVQKVQRRATRFDLADALLEIGLVITSITLLTQQRVYWFLGLAFGAVGLLAAASELAIH